MKSKHYKWQTRWTLDREAGTARHESGLTVRYTDGQVIPDNEHETVEALAPKNGHDSAAMVQRMLREAAALFEDRPYGER